MSLRLSAASILVGGLLGACAGEVDNEAELIAALEPRTVACPPLGITDAYTELVQPTCATANCHGAGSMQGGLSLEEPVAMLVDQPANTMGCESFLLVDSASVTDSLIVQILESPAPCSSTMPFAMGELNDDEKACIEAWTRSVAESR